MDSENCLHENLNGSMLLYISRTDMILSNPAYILYLSISSSSATQSSTTIG
jgi:hypothetical protein